MRHLLVHYKNKYPGAKVTTSDDALDVYSQEGEHLVALRRDGAGGQRDVSADLGCRDRHDLSPIPKDSRVWKNCPKTGAVVQDEKAGDRMKLREKFMADGRVMSCEELAHEEMGHGFKFDDKGQMIAEGKIK